jgi:hypothetical protein
MRKGISQRTPMKPRESFRNTSKTDILIKWKDLGKIGKFLDAYDLSKLNQEDINHLNRSITGNETEAVIMHLPTTKSPGLYGFTAEFYQTSKYFIR